MHMYAERTLFRCPKTVPCHEWWRGEYDSKSLAHRSHIRIFVIVLVFHLLHRFFDVM